MRYFDEEANVGHILNPKTGRSATGTFSTTIIAPTCTQADALATAVFVMGPVDGMALVETIEGVEALIVDDQSVIHRSTGLTEN
jgi:thiamine biosynthesis lipoprotein